MPTVVFIRNEKLFGKIRKYCLKQYDEENVQ